MTAVASDGETVVGLVNALGRRMTRFSGEATDAHHPCADKRERCSRETQEHPHTQLGTQLSWREYRGGEKQSDGQSHCGDEANNRQLTPSDSMRQMEPERSRKTSPDEEAERLAND